MSPYSLTCQFNPLHTFTPYFSKLHLFSHLYLSFASGLHLLGLLTKILVHLWFPPTNSKWVKEHSTETSLPSCLSGCCRSILSRTLFAMASTSNSLLTARWVTRSVGEKFTFFLLNIGGSSSSFICMNPVVLCKTQIFENNHVTNIPHKVYIKNYETCILSDVEPIREIT